MRPSPWPSMRRRTPTSSRGTWCSRPEVPGTASSPPCTTRPSVGRPIFRPCPRIQLRNSRTPGRQARQEPKSATSLVECAVRVSPTLARLIRKCAVTEAGGASPHDALLASAGIRGGEVEELRDQAKHLAQELRQAQESGARLRHTLDVTKAVVAQRD